MGNFLDEKLPNAESPSRHKFTEIDSGEGGLKDSAEEGESVGLDENHHNTLKDAEKYIIKDPSASTEDKSQEINDVGVISLSGESMLYN